MSGVFELSKPVDLLAKLERELERLRAEPDNVDHAFNLFITAEHILDWLYPGDAERKNRETLRNSDTLLQVVSHLANGAKHFDKLKSHHQSVKSTSRKGGYFASRYFPRGWFGRGYFSEPKLVVSLDGSAERKYGSSITALALAEEVCKFWSTPGRVPT
jgi:hypothetical protein